MSGETTFIQFLFLEKKQKKLRGIDFKYSPNEDWTHYSVVMVFQISLTKHCMIITC